MNDASNADHPGTDHQGHPDHPDQGVVDLEVDVRDPRGLSLRHDVRVPVLVALVSGVLLVAWFARALGSGSLLDWLWCAVPAAVGLLMLTVLRDARAPLLVADEQGVRVRHRETWNGVRWDDVERVEVRERAGLRDGVLVVHPGGGHESGAFSVPLGRGVHVVREGLDGSLVDDLGALAAGLVPVVVLAPQEPAQEPVEEPREAEEAPQAPQEQEPSGDRDDRTAAAVVEPIEVIAVRRDAESDVDHLPEQREPEVVLPARELRRANRDEATRDTIRRLPDPLVVPAERDGDQPVLVSRVDDLAASPVPVAAPVIGPTVAAARERARLSIDTLSERTRIRPHVLECIEVDDFAACGGDFYARGHLRTLARIFGLDGESLVGTYDELYASPELEARQVFEAELATGMGGGLRTAASGPRWSMLAAAVLVLVAIWGTTRVFSDTPQELVSPSPEIADTVGLTGSEEAEPEQPASTLGAIRVRTDGAASQVVVRDGNGRIVFAERLAAGAEQRIIGDAPFDVTASNGQAVQVRYLGKDRGTVGDSEAADNRRFG